MPELHRLDDAVDHHGGSEPRSETQEQHLAAPVAAQGLHGRVIDELHRTAERGGEIESDPSVAQGVRLHHRVTTEDRSGITDGNDVIATVTDGLLEHRDTLLMRQIELKW